MRPTQRRQFIARLVLLCAACGAVRTYAGSPTSVCVVSDGDCAVPGSVVNLTVQLGAGTTAITGAQLVLSYDPAALSFLAVSPGSSCDIASPFEAAILSNLDEANGSVFVAVNVDQVANPQGTAGPATLACLSFVVVGGPNSDVCLLPGANPVSTLLVDALGQSVPIDNSVDCPSGITAGALACDSVIVGSSCTCPPGCTTNCAAPNCSALDDACNIGVCDAALGACVAEPTNGGGACDDGDVCTTTDVCVSGVCTGSGCGNPSVCVVSDGDCSVPGSIVNFTVQLGPGIAAISGGQLLLSYDPAALSFLAVNPGSSCDPTSPFEAAILTSLNEVTGNVFVAVAVNDNDNPQGVTGPATLACLSFVVVGGPNADVCLLPGGNPVSTILVDALGQSIPIDNSTACPSGTGALACDAVAVGDSCKCALGRTPDCGALDDACNVGVCDAILGACLAGSTNEGGVCDDGDVCTTTDVCVGGVCTGSGCNNPSVCLTTETGCMAFEEIEIRIELGVGEPIIVGGQFVIEYDPSELQFVSAAPGFFCDVTSPFVLEVFESVNEATGEILYAAGVDFRVPNGGTMGPATVACLTFLALGSTLSDVCVLRGANPLVTVLADSFGGPVQAQNSLACPPDDPTTQVSCVHVEVDETCVCAVDTIDCSALDTDCRVGVCDERTGQCGTIPTNELEPCDDGNSCTLFDKCRMGECRGKLCQQPSLCVVAQDQCNLPGDLFEITIELGEGDPVITGGQFTINYDPLAFELLDISPGATCDAASPFTSELFETIDVTTGEVFYAVGVAFGQPGTNGPATMACLSFASLGSERGSVCLLDELNPFNTLLVNEFGNSIGIFNFQACNTNFADPIITCAEICFAPTVTNWGLVVITLLLLTAAKIQFGRMRRSRASA